MLSTPGTQVYVITDNHYAEGFGEGNRYPKFGAKVAISIYEPKGKAPLEAGGSVFLYEHGVKRGELKLGKRAQVQCEGTPTYLISAPKGISLPKKNAFALALGKELEAKKISSPETKLVVSAADKKHVEAVARGIFGKASGKAPKFTLGAVQVFSGSGKKLLLAQPSLLAGKKLHKVFLILPASGDKPEFEQSWAEVDLEDGKDSVDYAFVDFLDFDGDGVNELVVERRGYEVMEFLIYKFSGKTWKNVFTGGEAGC